MQFSAGCLLFVAEAAPVAHAAWLDNRSRTAAWRQGSGDPAAEGPETAEVQQTEADVPDVGLSRAQREADETVSYTERL